MAVFLIGFEGTAFPSDLEGSKLAIYGSITLDDVEALGAAAFDFPASEFYGAVQTGVIDGVIVKRIFGVPLEFYYALLAAAVIWYLFEFTAVGRRILFVGRGRDVAKLSGIHTNRIRWGCLVASGIIGAVAGALYAGTQGAADPTSGASYQLPAFAAAFLGSTSIMPGRFNPWGSTIAVYLLVTGITGLVFLGFPSFIQDIFYGGALVLAVSLSQIVRGRREQQF